MTQAKKLIEVAMPIKEISAESVRDKSIRHGHISTLHLWWARRPLPVCRAVVFASLVPDPLDENCPQAFKDAVELVLGKDSNPGDPYKPYDDIPYTTALDHVEDNLRNRLLMFIGKFSKKHSASLKAGKKGAAKDMLSDESLIKWDNKNNDAIINKARKLIWVAYNAPHGGTAQGLLADFDLHYKTIKEAEKRLYSISDRHILTEDVTIKKEALNNAIEAFLNKMPRVFDPFAGGGAIPLEAARLGCRSYGNDINPVAHIIQKGSLEFPQKYGKPITYSKEEFIKFYGEEHWNLQPQVDKIIQNGEAVAVRVLNRLAFDVEFYAKEILCKSEKEIGYLYPVNEEGIKPIAYYWVLSGNCSNPSCRAEVPLLKQFYLCNKADKKIHLKPIIEQRKITFEIREGEITEKGWINRGNLACPCCGSVTDVKSIKQQSVEGQLKHKLLAVIQQGKDGKEYRLPNHFELKLENLQIGESISLTEKMQRNSAGGDTFSWGISEWGQLFSKRQLFVLNTLISQLNESRLKANSSFDEYNKAIITYLAIWIDRVSAVQTSFGRWDIGYEKIQTPFARQAIQMIFDYPEGNIFSDKTGSALNHLEWIIKYIESEGETFSHTICQNASSGDKSQFNDKYLTAVVTDPPYYDAIAYADISDFFYVWLKRSLGDVYPSNFSTPQTPKTEECTALKHHHGSKEAAKAHFERKLLEIFDAIEHQTSDIVSIMFAHQSTEAWTTLCNSILGARLNITGSWAIDTELTNRSIGLAGAALASSVTVSCRPIKRSGYGDYKEVKKAIQLTVNKEVEVLYQLGFRGADLLTACFGQAVSEFGKYEQVEKADGTEVTVAELLEMARESAFNALLKGFDGDEYTKFYIGWLELNGFTESDFDDAAKFAKAGLTINVAELFRENLFIKNKSKQTLATYQSRIAANKRLGEEANSFLIDQVHKAMALYKGTNRGVLLRYIANVGATPENNFWRVITSLCEVLPTGSDDHKQATGLLENRDSLIRESKTVQATVVEQTSLF